LRGEGRHEDGEGPLGSIGGPGYEALGVDPTTGATSWAFGVRLCVAVADSEVRLRSVVPTRTIGTGARDLGAFIRTFTLAGNHMSIVGVEGFPPGLPDVPDDLFPVADTVVSSACYGSFGDPYTELLVGLGLADSGGGGWNGIDVRYVADGRELILHLNHDLLICGPAVEADPTVRDACT
jgi:hypothetical protein